MSVFHRAIAWIKTHKLLFVLLLIIGYLLFKNIGSTLYKTRAPGLPLGNGSALMYQQGISTGVLNRRAPDTINSSYEMLDSAPPTTTQSRMVVENSSLSLVVDNVRQTLKSISTYASSLGGYMVNSDLNSPLEGDFGTISIRVPSKSLEQTLEYLRSQAVRVVSENLQGQDVTDQYEDIETKLILLEKNKKRFEEIMDQAVKIEDILQIQQQIFSIQSQIDALKGRQQYLKANADLALVTVYASTDELALPYAPSNVWRPKVVFKEAVRSLLMDLRQVGSALIWVMVYAIIWLPLLIIGVLIYRRFNKKTPPITRNS